MVREEANCHHLVISRDDLLISATDHNMTES